MNANTVSGLCANFLSKMFGTVGLAPGSADGLRLICLGNAEMTVQGELLCFLKNAANESDAKVVSECGTSSAAGGIRLNPDITIFDSSWNPTCLIELKHFSANQGPSTVLLQNMQLDRLRIKNSLLAGLPLVQVGLCTEVQNRGALGPEHGFYRFLRTWYTPSHYTQVRNIGSSMTKGADGWAGRNKNSRRLIWVTRV